MDGWVWVVIAVPLVVIAAGAWAWTRPGKPIDADELAALNAARKNDRRRYGGAGGNL